MFGLGGAEIMVIVLAAVILFGPQKIPEIARTLGTFYKELTRLRRQADHALSEIRREVDLGLDDAETARPRPHPQAVSTPDSKPLPVPLEDDYLATAEGGGAGSGTPPQANPQGEDRDDYLGGGGR